MGNMNAREYRQAMADKQEEIEVARVAHERLHEEVAKRDIELYRVRTLRNCALVLLGVLLVIAVAL